MNRSIFRRYVAPFLQWFFLMLILTIILDYGLHYFHLIRVGRYLGIVGTVMILLSFLYSLRKRRIIKSGHPKKFLLMHEYFAWGGSVLVLVHAGIHFNALLPWAAIVLMVIAIASGLTGKYLLKKANETFQEKKLQLTDSGMNAEEAEKQLFFDAITVDVMKKWRVIHMPITLLFCLLTFIHIITVLMYMK